MCLSTAFSFIDLHSNLPSILSCFLPDFFTNIDFSSTFIDCLFLHYIYCTCILSLDIVSRFSRLPVPNVHLPPVYLSLVYLSRLYVILLTFVRVINITSPLSFSLLFMCLGISHIILGPSSTFALRTSIFSQNLASPSMLFLLFF